MGVRTTTSIIESAQAQPRDRVAVLEGLERAWQPLSAFRGARVGRDRWIRNGSGDDGRSDDYRDDEAAADGLGRQTGRDRRQYGIDPVATRRHRQGVIYGLAGLHVPLRVKSTTLRQGQAVVREKTRLEMFQRLVGHQLQGNDDRLAGDRALRELKLQAHRAVAPAGYG